MIFVLQLSSCDSSNGGTPSGSSGTPIITIGEPAAGSSGSGAAGGAGPAIAGGGGAPASAGGPAAGGVGGLSGGGGTGGTAPPCTDKQNPDHEGEPCSIWPEWDLEKGAGEAKDCDASWLTGAATA